MRMKQLLQNPDLAGITRQFVYYLESQKYISPRTFPRGRTKGREYSLEDVRIIKEMWMYNKSGISPSRVEFIQANNSAGLSEGSDLFSRTSTTIPGAVLFFHGQSPLSLYELGVACRALFEVPEFQQIAGVFSSDDTVTFVGTVGCQTLSDLYTSEKIILNALGIQNGRCGTGIIVDFVAYWADPTRSNETEGTLGFILMTIAQSQVFKTFHALTTLPYILEVAIVYGGRGNIFVKVTSEGTSAFLRRNVPNIDSVETMRIYVVLSPEYYFSRRTYNE